MQMNRTAASKSKRRSSSVFLSYEKLPRQWLGVWASTGRALELAHLHPFWLGFPERVVIALTLILVARLAWVWS
jgi:hypothetical protein